MSETVEDWTLPQRARPPLLGELVERIDEALATARASESTVMRVGAAALDAADQARRAAELAERASAAAQAVSRTVVPASDGADGARVVNGAARPSHTSPIDDFSARADRLAERLRRLQRIPLSV